MTQEKKVIIALDGITAKQALELAAELKDHVWGFKVNDLLISHGIKIVEQLARLGKVFADPKLHDIPNTVSNGIKRFENAGANLITIHASGGNEMIKAAANSANNAKILAVTVLTSISPTECNKIYNQETPLAAVTNLAINAINSGADGIVCSPEETQSLTNNPQLPQKTLIVTPGIRPTWSTTDDQKRIKTPKQAINEGSSLLVIGPPNNQLNQPN